jgi:imidazolonepropionase-like amidohydrolase
VPPQGAEIIDLAGAFVTPGLVDMHSHVGVYSFPQDVHANEDGNEMTNPATPFVRAIDAFAPEDPARVEIVSSGVTTSQILPGSGNVMGGQALQIKFRKVGTVEGMRVKNGPVALKMACGEVRDVFDAHQNTIHAI